MFSPTARKGGLLDGPRRSLLGSAAFCLPPEPGRDTARQRSGPHRLRNLAFPWVPSSLGQATPNAISLLTLPVASPQGSRTWLFKLLKGSGAGSPGHSGSVPQAQEPGRAAQTQDHPSLPKF